MYNGFEEVYKSNYGNVYRYVKRMIRENDSAVEDVVQEVFFVAYEKWDMLLDHPNIPGFLMVVARNKIRKWYDKQSKVYVNEESVLEYLEGDTGKPDGVDPFTMVDLYTTMEKVLSHKEIDILRRYYEYGYTSSEMAKMLGVTESCFKVRVLRMKEKLKSGLKGFSMLSFLIPVCVMISFL